jgi:regulator of protease activity HflC (stomatin/prohibitin superfamily)
MSTPSALAPPHRSTVVDKQLTAANGYVMIAIGLVLIAVCAWLITTGYDNTGHALPRVWFLLPAIVRVAAAVAQGLVILQPNESLVCMLFGSYVGTEHRPGFWWVNPFNSKSKVSRRLEILESGPLKVVWRVEDAAKALLEVTSYAAYVKSQSEAALRRVVSVHPYDQVETEEAERQGERLTSGASKPTPVSTVSLRDGGDAVIEALLHEVRARMEPIGISVLEARISHLAYSSEIAGAMLRKQAASAVVAARRMIVRGAVSIVEDALNELDKKKLADALDPERKAAMISNLLVVLVGDREVTPVINTGTLYS